MKLIVNLFFRSKRKLLWVCCLGLLWVNISGTAADAGKVKALFFHAQTCPECRTIKDEFLPEIAKKYRGQLEIKSFEITSVENFELLIGLERSLRRKIDKTPPLMIVGADILEGQAAIRAGFERAVIKYLKSNGTDWPVLAVQSNPDGNAPGVEQFRGLTPFAIIGGGLLDGINPCAFTTLIFLISYLTMLGRKGKELIFTGAVFTTGVFIAYFLIGYGLLELLNRFSFFNLISDFLTWAMIGILGLLCVLSLYDYFLVKQGRLQEIKLQLNDYFKQKIHAAIREKSRAGSYLIAGFGMGFLVALLEFPCTGQIYFPIIFVLRGAGALKSIALFYLLLYNLMFILPLIVVFGLVYWGITSNQIAGIMLKNLAGVKLLSALFFGMLAILLLVFH